MHSYYTYVLFSQTKKSSPNFSLSNCCLSKDWMEDDVNKTPKIATACFWKPCWRPRYPHISSPPYSSLSPTSITLSIVIITFKYSKQNNNNNQYSTSLTITNNTITKQETKIGKRNKKLAWTFHRARGVQWAKR